jgi:hypothetical protein
VFCVMSKIVSSDGCSISYVALRVLFLEKMIGGVSSMQTYDESLTFDSTLAVHM